MTGPGRGDGPVGTDIPPESVRISRAFAQALAASDQLTVAVIITDLEGIVVAWNHYAEVVYGWPAETALGQPVQQLTVGPVSQEQSDEIMAQLARGRSWFGEFDARRSDGQIIRIVIVDAPLTDEHGEIVGIVGISREVHGELPTIRRELDELRRLSEHLDLVRREEQRRIAADLHDDIAQRIALISIRLGSLTVGEPDREDADRAVRDSIDMLRDTLRALEDVCELLRPPMLDELGFAGSLEHLVDTVARRAGLAAECRVDPAMADVDPGQADIVFRICGEALSNVERHARAGRVEIDVVVDRDVVTARVRDDGRGLGDPVAVGGFGTRLMRERARSHGGRVTIGEGIGGAGTGVTLVLPAQPLRGV